MIVAVSVMRVVQVTGDQVIGVVTVRKRLVTAAFPVMMPSRVAGACMVGDTSIGVGATDGNAMIVDMASVDVVEMSVVEIVGVSFVAEHGVPAARPVNVTVMTLMLGTAHCLRPPLLERYHRRSGTPL